MPVVDHIGPRTLPSFLAGLVERIPDKTALVFESCTGETREFTYAQLGDYAARTAAGFAALGVEAGDKVVLHLPNRPEFVFAFFGLAHLGAVAVPSNVANRVKELTHVVTWSDAKVVLTTPDFVSLVEDVLPHAPAVGCVVVTADADAAGRHVPFAELLGSQPAAPAAVDTEDPVEIIFTSGTTSLPKGVVLTHANWLWSGERSSHSFKVDERDRLLTALPLFHVNAQSFTLMTALTVGATAIFIEAYSASRFMEQVRLHRATHTCLVAMLVRTLLAQPPSPDDADHHLRRITYAINVTTAEKEAFERRFGVELINGYGLSEAMTEVSVCPVSGEKRWPSIGRPAIGREIRLVDELGREVEQGEVGEITVKGVPGRTIMKEYYKDPDATARTIVEGWLHTGDNGYFDERGYLYFFDRRKDMIKRAGENVSASEVEGVLTDHPDVLMAAVIGVPDPVRDEAVMAFVVPEPGVGLTAEDIVRHCEAVLSPFKVPTAIEFLDALPMTSIGKVEKKQLRALAARTAQGASP